MDKERPATNLHDSHPPAPDGDIVIYNAPPPDDTPFEVRLERDTLWLTQRQMARLFRTSASNVSRHLGNVFDEGELDPSATTEDFSMVRSEGDRQVRRTLTHYNLDAAISIGYRVDSKRAVPFRRWADQVLRSRWLATSIREAVLDTAARYALTWRLLLEYDEDRLEVPRSTQPAATMLDHGQAVAAIADFKAALIARGEASPLFGNPRGDALEGILGNVWQTMLGEPLHRTREERAANLLYFLVKDRPFTEGNKRIGTLLFLLYLRQEGLSHYLNPHALTALTLLIAASAPANKDLMIRIIVNLLAEPSA